ncbi:disease resistance protein TAO1 [Arabidopsis lyrata subsp. lyrata]|nr:disease resistance protein TAO1 [Arabidopsis lyrata subsp. lyrata]|eukprot:XP_020871221.1 disease resistance protein TAO1 [Arabidopsis lyrata subsp. lyrata]
MGSHFKRKSKQEWKNALPSLKNRLHADIVSVLKVSYDALCDDNKNLFIHIACYFNHEELEKVVAYLANCFENVRHRLDVLAEKSLLSMENSKIGMHSLLVKLGKDIVRKQFDEPGQRQFFVDSGENCEVLLADEATGSRGVIGIDCRFNGRKLNISGRAFERMSNLQFLRLKGFYYDAWYISHGLSYLSPKLRILDWNYFPATRLPSNFNLKFLAELDMSK